MKGKKKRRTKINFRVYLIKSILHPNLECPAHPRGFGFFREKFWGNQKVGFWYRQNIFLYLKKDTEVFNLFNNKGFSPLQDFSFMNCIHPELYDSKCSQAISFSVHAKEIIPSLFRAIKKRIVRK